METKVQKFTSVRKNSKNISGKKNRSAACSGNGNSEKKFNRWAGWPDGYLNFLFNIYSHFENLQSSKKIAAVGSKFGQILNKPYKKLEKLLIFAKSGNSDNEAI